MNDDGYELFEYLNKLSLIAFLSENTVTSIDHCIVQIKHDLNDDMPKIQENLHHLTNYTNQLKAKGKLSSLTTEDLMAQCQLLLQEGRALISSYQAILLESNKCVITINQDYADHKQATFVLDKLDEIKALAAKVLHLT